MKKFLCQLFTGGKHDFRYNRSRWRCRWCGALRYKTTLRIHPNARCFILEPKQEWTLDPDQYPGNIESINPTIQGGENGLAPIE